MALNPWLSNNFLDSCAFDPKYNPEDRAATEIFRLHKEDDLGIIITHSTQKEIDHPNAPARVKREAGGLIYTHDTSLTQQERLLIQNIESTLAGNGKRDSFSQDARHIFESQKYGGYFITTDKRLIKKRQEIRQFCAANILLASEFLSLVREHTNPYKKSGP